MCHAQEWAEIVKGYEQGNVYLAECGQQLARLVNYEIPTLKHQITRSQQTIRVRWGVCHVIIM